MEGECYFVRDRRMRIIIEKEQPFNNNGQKWSEIHPHFVDIAFMMIIMQSCAPRTYLSSSSASYLDQSSLEGEYTA